EPPAPRQSPRWLRKAASSCPFSVRKQGRRNPEPFRWLNHDHRYPAIRHRSLSRSTQRSVLIRVPTSLVESCGSRNTRTGFGGAIALVTGGGGHAIEALRSEGVRRRPYRARPGCQASPAGLMLTELP